MRFLKSMGQKNKLRRLMPFMNSPESCADGPPFPLLEGEFSSIRRIDLSMVTASATSEAGLLFRSLELDTGQRGGQKVNKHTLYLSQRRALDRE